jgi:hypothetical protein
MMMSLTEMIISILRERIALLSETAEADWQLLAVYQFLLAAFVENEVLPDRVSTKH